MTTLDIKIFLLRKGIAQKQIAEALGVHKSLITLLLSGQLKTEERLEQIAAYLEIPRATLFN